jgi:tetratricopeptide (TPR) repeat protein
LGDGRTTTDRVKAATGHALYRALTTPPVLPAAPIDLETLRAQVGTAWRLWQTSRERYTELTTRLPSLISRTEQALRANRAAAELPQHRDAERLAADLYALVRTVAKRLGRVDLSLVAADRAVRAGEAGDDPLRLAAARWNVAQVLLADGEPEGAETVAVQALNELRPWTAGGDLDAIALQGALLLIAAIAAARLGNPWQAHERLGAAEPLAALTGERNSFWCVFGPTNVAMYRVSVEMETGQATEGLRLAEQVNHDRSPSIERRVAFLLDQAKGHQQRRDYASALLLLGTAEREAPEDMQYRPSAHVILRSVIERGRRPVAAEAARLAGRIGLTV